MTQKLNINKTCSDTLNRRPAGNTGLAKVADQCSTDTFVINQSLVLRINICGENRQLLVVANRVCLESMSSTNIECFTKDGRQLK